MPFRQKIKKVFGRSSSQSDSGSSGSSRKQSSVYQPGEPTPAPKYRGFVDPKHKARLETFSFGASDWRRKSTNSAYSPMGSKMPSRHNSIHGPQHHFGQSQASPDETEETTTTDDAKHGPVDDGMGANEHREYADMDDTSAPRKPEIAT